LAHVNRPFLDASAISKDRSVWQPISRGEALQACRSFPVAVLQRALSREAASWFDPSNRFYKADGPYLYDSLRYFLFTGPWVEKGLAKGLAVPPKPKQAELEPMDAFDPATGEFISLGSPVRKAKEKHPIEFQLVDGAGKAVADAEYEIVLPDGSVRRGKTDAEGLVKVEDNFHKGEAKLTLKSAQSLLTADATTGGAAIGAKEIAPEVTGELTLKDVSLSSLLDAADRIPDIPEIPAVPVLPEIPKIPLPVEILLTDAKGIPLSNASFQVQFPDGEIRSGKSDPAGLIRFPDNTQTGDLLFKVTGLQDKAA
jgi:hypothetical protein